MTTDTNRDIKIVKEKKGIVNILRNIIYALIGAGIVALFIIMYLRSRA